MRLILWQEVIRVIAGKRGGMGEFTGVNGRVGLWGGVIKSTNSVSLDKCDPCNIYPVWNSIHELWLHFKQVPEGLAK